MVGLIGSGPGRTARLVPPARPTNSAALSVLSCTFCSVTVSTGPSLINTSGSRPDAITVENKGGFRGARGPDQLLASVRARYAFKAGGGRSLQAWVDVFNLTNRANFSTPTSDRRDTATFLILRTVVNPTRTAQLNLRYSF